MPMIHTVDQEGRYDGLTLREALPSVISEIVRACDPVEVILLALSREVRRARTLIWTCLSCSSAPNWLSGVR